MPSIPMKTSRLPFLWQPILALVLVVAAGCSTLQYRTVQSRFEEAVRTDNERFAMPFTDATGGYQAVANELTPDYIANLDPMLRPNAWTLRAVSQWRAGDSAQAVASALEGRAEITRLIPRAPQLENGRDSIILTMLPGLVEDTRLRRRFNERGAPDVAAHYNEYAARFHTALRALTEARKQAGPATPAAVIHYWNYQSWRVLQNWNYIIANLPMDGIAAATRDADTFVESALADIKIQAATLSRAIEEIRNALPEQHPYRQLIELESLR